MTYDLIKTKNQCKALGLIYFGDNYMQPFMQSATDAGLTQEQFDTSVWCALLHTRYLFTPQNYSISGRICLAWHFLFGKQPKGK